jgi:hypothetical protein
VVITPWTPIEGCPPELAEHHDAGRDERFRQLVADAVADVLPPEMIFHLLALDADIYAAPSAFWVRLKEEPNDWHFVPEVSERLRLLPWREQDEATH